MLKVGIIMFQNMRYAPFLKTYVDLLESINNVEYNIVYLNRDKSLNELNDRNHIAVDWIGRGSLTAPLYEKIINFFYVFPVNVMKILRKQKYDFLIILTTFPAVLLYPILTNKYRKRYIVDIRDYTQEKNRIYYGIESAVFRNARMCIISSEGYKNFLPPNKYFICSNCNMDDTPIVPYAKNERSTIIISYIGTIAYEKQCIQLIDLVKKDKRFEFHFYGNDITNGKVTNYVNKLNNRRIVMKGKYNPEEKRFIYSKSDIIFNCYGNDTILVKYAISNKYYDGALNGKPLIVSPNTTMASISREFAFPLDLDNTDNLNELYNWYKSINKKEFDKYSKEVIIQAKNNNKRTFGRLKKIIIAINNRKYK